MGEERTGRGEDGEVSEERARWGEGRVCEVVKQEMRNGGLYGTLRRCR